MSDSYALLAADRGLRNALLDSTGLAAIEYVRSIDSTQRRARELAAEEAPDWTIVVADYQTAGRGQHGRRWTAQSGSSVMFSLIVRPRSPEAMALIPIRVGLAAAGALESLIGNASPRAVMLKWPNDLMANDAKLGGILCEGQVRGDELRAIVGVGINVHPFEPQAGVTASPAYLDEIAGRDVERLDVLQAVAGCIRSTLDIASPRLTAVELARFSGRDWLAGRRIDEPVAGTVQGINAMGHLLVSGDDERVEELVTGSVRLVG